ncbi:hypothetical protein [Roseburia hominis]|uniref:hypothetical protein n=1 Tax=Roseburia hominis TaxID=301301 RepID=UPI0022E497A8|nr:hypothetical protein [Roseburia hominis]
MTIETKKGIENCPHSKAIDEVIIENAFVEMFGLLAENFDDVLESVLSSIEETLSKDDSAEKLKRIEKDIASLEKKRKKLTDMYLDDKLTKEAYDDKYSELSKNWINVRKREQYSPNVHYHRKTLQIR